MLRIIHRTIPSVRRRYEVGIVINSGLFDAEWYSTKYNDIERYPLSPAWHYILLGYRQQRNPGPFFDAARYLSDYPDVLISGSNPLVHYLEYGWSEKRLIFASDPYYRKNSDRGINGE